MLELTLEAISEGLPGPKWATLFERSWPVYNSWFVSEGERARPYYLSSVRALRAHMPELMPTYERLVELAGGGDHAARFLSLYCPPPYVSGCSQVVWQGPTPLLVRNYDYSPQLWDAMLMKTAWNGRQVIAMCDCMWGVLDGMNDAGLAVSLSFGGRRVVGEGFGLPLILRYVLEFCTTTAEAVSVLERVPSHMAYNVTMVDADGEFVTVFLGPDRPASVRKDPVATNHQDKVEWQQHARATATELREKFLYARLRENVASPEKLIGAFLHYPLYSTAYKRGFGTLYTAAYRPGEGTVDYLWPRVSWRQSFSDFEEGVRVVRFPYVPDEEEEGARARGDPT